MVAPSTSKRGGKGRGRGRRGGGRGSDACSGNEGDKPDDLVREDKAEEKDDEAAPPEASHAGLGKWEQRLWAEGFPVVAGTDEAGRGPLAGPVVAAAFAVLAHDDKEVRDLLLSVADSKQMNAADRDAAFEQLVHERFQGRTVWAVAEASASVIDDTNILSAALTCMAQSVQQLNVRPDCVLVDGCNRPPELLKPGETWTRGTKEERRREEEIKQIPKLSRWFTPKQDPAAASKQKEKEKTDDVWRPRSVEAVIHGDALVPSISAASVIAKVHRDRIMSKLHDQYPVYGFASHQGYGTEGHFEALRVHGPCPEHRRSFRPVREALGLEEIDSTVDAGQQTLTNLMGSKSSVKHVEHETPEKCDLNAPRHELNKGADSHEVNPVGACASQLGAAAQDTKRVQCVISKTASETKSAGANKNNRKRKVAMKIEEDGEVAKCSKQ